MLRLTNSVFAGRGYFFRGTSLRWSLPLSESVSLRPTEAAETRSLYPRATATPEFSNNRLPDKFLTKQKLWRDFGKVLSSVKGKNLSHFRLLNMMKLLGGPQVIEPPSVRVEMVDDFWKSMKEKGIAPEVHIYNILLRVYNCNNHKFSPSEFLELMKENSVSPNMGTFTLLIEAYCLQGNIGGASKLLEYMKSMDMPLSEPIYGHLVTGHGRAGDMDAAEQIIATMKANNHTPHNVVYTSLLRAYAERGDITSLEKVYSRMHSERLFPSIMAYTEVISTLSKYGHAAHVPRVLDLLKNKEWISADLRTLVCDCLSRGEVEVPLILIKELARSNGLHNLVLSLYIVTCMEQGQSISSILKDLDMDLQMFPNLHHSVVNRMILSHQPKVLSSQASNSPPEPGALAPHPQGNTWGENLLQLYRLIGSAEIPNHYYYPLLARYCSEVNLEGFVSCLKQMLMRNGIRINTIEVKYILKMESNAGKSIDDYIGSKLGEYEVGSKEWNEMTLLRFLLHLILGRVDEAQQLVGNFEQTNILLKNSTTVCNAVKFSVRLPEHSPMLVQLFKKLQTLRHPPNIEQCIIFCFHSHLLNNRPATDLVQFLAALERAPVKLTLRCYLYLMKNLSSVDKRVFEQTYFDLMGKGVDLDKWDVVIMLEAAYKTQNFKIAEYLYQLLPPDLSENKKFKSLYLLSLSSVPDTMNLLDSMLSEGQVPDYNTWHRLVTKVLKRDPAAASYLLEQMKLMGFEPNDRMKHDLLRIYLSQGDIEKAKGQMEAILLKGGATVKMCLSMVNLLAEEGNMEEMTTLVEDMKGKNLSKEDKINLSFYVLKACLKSCNFGEVLSQVEADGPSLVALNVMFEELIKTDGLPKDEILSSLNKFSHSVSIINSLLFFAYVDCNKEEEAALLIQKVDLNPEIVQMKMSSSNASTYLRMLERCNYHERSKEITSLISSYKNNEEVQKGLPQDTVPL